MYSRFDSSHHLSTLFSRQLGIDDRMDGPTGHGPGPPGTRVDMMHGQMVAPACQYRPKPNTRCHAWMERAVFLFLHFSISFFTKIYFRFRNLQIYTPASPLPGGRHLVVPLRGGREFSTIFNGENLRVGPWRTGRPAAGRPPSGCWAAGSPSPIWRHFLHR